MRDLWPFVMLAILLVIIIGLWIFFIIDLDHFIETGESLFTYGDNVYDFIGTILSD